VHTPGSENGTAEICRDCYDQTQEAADRMEAALHMDPAGSRHNHLRRPVWADTSDPEQTYVNAAQALLHELRQRSGLPSTPGAPGFRPTNTATKSPPSAFSTHLRFSLASSEHEKKGRVGETRPSRLGGTTMKKLIFRIPPVCIDCRDISLVDAMPCARSLKSSALEAFSSATSYAINPAWKQIPQR